MVTVTFASRRLQHDGTDCAAASAARALPWVAMTVRHADSRVGF